MTTAAATAAGLDPTLERRTLDLKGKRQATEVLVLRATDAPPDSSQATR